MTTPRQHPESVHGPRVQYEILKPRTGAIGGFETVHTITTPEQLSEMYGWHIDSCRALMATSSPMSVVVPWSKYGAGRLPGEPIKLTEEQVNEWRRDR